MSNVADQSSETVPRGSGPTDFEVRHRRENGEKGPDAGGNQVHGSKIDRAALKSAEQVALKSTARQSSTEAALKSATPMALKSTARADDGNDR